MRKDLPHLRPHPIHKCIKSALSTVPSLTFVASLPGQSAGLASLRLQGCSPDKQSEVTSPHSASKHSHIKYLGSTVSLNGSKKSTLASAKGEGLHVYTSSACRSMPVHLQERRACAWQQTPPPEVRQGSNKLPAVRGRNQRCQSAAPGWS